MRGPGASGAAKCRAPQPAGPRGPGCKRCNLPVGQAIAVDPSLVLAGDTPRLIDEWQLEPALWNHVRLVVRDLRIYGQAAEAQVYHYRDNTDLEVDAIVETADGGWAAFEIKLGSSRVDEAAANLLKLADRVDAVHTGEPSLLGVIVGPGYGFVRDDGVAVIPLGALGP